MKRKVSQHALKLGIRKGELSRPIDEKAIKKGTRPELIAWQRAINRLLASENRVWQKENERQLRKADKIGYVNYRGLMDYSDYFRELVDDEIITLARKIAAKKRKPIKVLDDGAGNGRFLSELKSELKRQGIECETTAATLFANKELMKKVERKEVNRVKISSVVEHVPDRKYDLITSRYGGIFYQDFKTPNSRRNELLKALLLRSAYSLEKNGVALIMFNNKPIRKTGSALILHLTESPRKPNVEEGHWQGIVRSMEKRGFRIKSDKRRSKVMITRFR